MHLKGIFRLTFIFIALVFAFPANAQAPIFDYIRESEGLSSNRQWSKDAIHIDDHGFVWLATGNGLNRFDGDKIKSFIGVDEPPYDLPYNIISAITEDRDGNLWLGTQEEGIIIFNPRLETFTPFKNQDYIEGSEAFSQINSLETDQHGDVIICTAFQGIYRYKVAEHKLEEINYKADKNPNNSSASILLLSDHRLLVIMIGDVLIGDYTNPNEEWDYYLLDPGAHISDATEYPDGKIHLIAQNRTEDFIIDPSKKSVSIKENVFENASASIYVDSEKNIWKSIFSGILLKHDWEENTFDTFRIFTDVNGSNLDISLMDMFDDGNGNIYYMSGASGAGRFNSSATHPIQFVQPMGLSAFRIQNNILFASNTHDILRIENEGITTIPLSTASGDYILNFEIDHEGDFWVSRDGKQTSLAQYDSSGQLIGPKYNERSNTHFIELSDDTLCMGMFMVEKDLKDRPYNFVGEYYERLSGEEYPDFKSKFHIETYDGELWIATWADGIIRIFDDKKKYEFLSIDENGNGKLNSNNPYYIYESTDHSIYVFTDNGINIWHPARKEFTYISHPDVNQPLSVKGMVEDVKGNLWMALKDRVSRIDGQTGGYHSFALHPDFRIERTESQDLQIDDNGIIYFEGLFGIVKFDPKKLEMLPEPNKVVFTDLFVNRKRVFPNDESGLLDSSVIYQHNLKVTYDKRDLGFSFVSPQGNDVLANYFYRLKGYKHEWQVAPKNREIHFTSLNPGNYAMEVKAQSGNGKWTKEISSIKFKVEAPWYQRWWAYLLYAASLSLAAYLFYRYRVNQILKYQALRTKISSDLHDDVGSILGSIAMESEMLSYDKTSKISDELKRLSAMTRDAMSRMRDTVWAIDSRKDEVGFLSDRMKDYLNDTLRRSNFEYQFVDNIEVTKKSMSPDIRQNVYLIFKEAINNVLKHSNGDLITVAFKQQGQKYFLSIKDNGQIEEPMKTSGLGMSNMNMRAELVGAKLEVSRQDGFEVRLVF